MNPSLETSNTLPNGPRPVSKLAVGQLFSVNQFKTWTKCQKKYYFDYVQKLRWPSDQSRFSFGRTLHKLFEYQARSLPFDALLKGLTTEPEADKIRQAWAQLMAHPVPHYTVLGSEWAFTVPVGPYWVTGRIDRVVQEPETGKVLILDWKTGTSVPRLPENDWQTIIYQFAVVEAAAQLANAEGHLPFELPLKPEQVAFVYIEIKDEVREIRIPYDSAKHEMVRQRMTEALTQMQTASLFDLPASCPDSFCPYRYVCGIEADEG